MSADVDFKACRHMGLKTLEVQYVQKRPLNKVLIARIYGKNVHDTNNEHIHHRYVVIVVI